MIKGVIFDLDGVLVSTDELHFKAWSQLAQKLGIQEYSREDNKRQKGISRLESLEIVLEKGERKYSTEEKKELAEEKNGIYVQLLQELNEEAVLAQVRETLEFLHEKGIRIGVGSVSRNTPLILKKTGLEGYMDGVSCGLDITHSKPDPEVFLKAAQKLGLKPEQCLVVEDSEAGIIAARAAGMKSLAVGPEREQLGADRSANGLYTDVDWMELLM